MLWIGICSLQMLWEQSKEREPAGISGSGDLIPTHVIIHCNPNSVGVIIPKFCRWLRVENQLLRAE